MSPSPRALPRVTAAFCLALALAMGAQAADAPPPKAGGDTDALRSLLAESKDKGRGVSIYTNGATLQVVVVAVEERYVSGTARTVSKVTVTFGSVFSIPSIATGGLTP